MVHCAFVIVAHVPYLRSPGRMPQGEDQLHETIARSLVPLINLLSDLQALQIAPRVGLAFSPLLLEQLADPVIQKHFVLWMERWLAAREQELDRAEQTGDQHRVYLARFYLDWGHGILESFVGRYDRNLVAALREFCAAEIAEPLACPATFAYLPGLGRAEAIAAQVEHGTLNITRHLGRPQGLWLPGCGWRPGLEEFIAATGLRYLIADPSSLPASLPPRAYWLIGRRLAAIFCDQALGTTIWSREMGYLGDPLYLTAARAERAQPYDPYHAFRRAQEHATHFVSMLVEQADRYASTDDALLLLPIETALLGQYWFEGPTWLQAVLTIGSTHPAVKLTSPGEFLRTHRPQRGVVLESGSWGPGGDHRAWINPATATYWHDLHAAEERLVHMARDFAASDGDGERLLNQAARELLLAQTGDWSLLLTAGNTHAARRGQTYTQRCMQLCDLAASRRLDAEGRALLNQFEELDGPFPSLNYRIFG